jgi:hypothetical protein
MATAVRMHISAPFPKSQEEELQHMTESCKKELSLEIYQELFEEGRNCDLEEAVARLLRFVCSLLGLHTFSTPIKTKAKL